MDAVDTMTPDEIEATEIIRSHLKELDQMFPPFTPGIKDFKIYYSEDELHLKGEKTILSMPLSKVLDYFKRTD